MDARWVTVTDRELIDLALSMARTYKGAAIREAIPGVTEHDISRWKKEAESTLSAQKRLDILAWIQDIQEKNPLVFARLSENRRMLREMARSYPSQLELPDISFLAPKARAFFDESIGSWMRRQWTYETIENAARLLVGYFNRTSTLQSSGTSVPELSEDDQVLVLKESREEIEAVFDREGPGSRP